MRKGRKGKSFIKNPYYEGGTAAMKAFVKKHKTYPKSALEKKIEGRVRVRYKINYLGKVVEAKLVSGIGHGCDEEAIRVVKLLEFNVPKNRGVRVHFFKMININFKLPKPPQATISYQISSPKKQEDTKKSGTSGTYSYTIDI